jgi:hypothetical protein
MKQICLLFIITLLFASCKKDDVDPRDQYVGHYQIQQVGVTVVNGQSRTANFVYELNINKAGASDELAFSDGFGNYTAKLTGSSFKINKFVTSLKSNGIDLAFDVIGNGSFNGSNINYTQSFSGNGIIITATCTGSK